MSLNNTEELKKKYRESGFYLTMKRQYLSLSLMVLPFIGFLIMFVLLRDNEDFVNERAGWWALIGVFSFMVLFLIAMFVFLFLSNSRILRKPDLYRLEKGIVTSFKQTTVWKGAMAAIKFNSGGSSRELTCRYIPQNRSPWPFIKVGTGVDIIYNPKRNTIIIVSLRRAEENEFDLPLFDEEISTPRLSMDPRDSFNRAYKSSFVSRARTMMMVSIILLLTFISMVIFCAFSINDPEAGDGFFLGMTILFSILSALALIGLAYYLPLLLLLRKNCKSYSTIKGTVISMAKSVLTNTYTYSIEYEDKGLVITLKAKNCRMLSHPFSMISVGQVVEVGIMQNRIKPVILDSNL